MVAPIELRAGGAVGALLPELGAKIQDMSGGGKLARRMAEGSATSDDPTAGTMRS